MSLACRGLFIVGAKRTPFCSHGGPLQELPASHAFAAAAKEAIRSANIDATVIDNTVVGNVNFLSQCDGGKTPRYCGIYSGVAIEKPALGVNKACGSGIQAIITGAMDIITGSSNVTLTGGTEMMSSLPFFVRNVRFGTALGATYKVEDSIKKQFLDSYTGLTLQKMAENLALKYKISRDEADHFALYSHLKWKSAQDRKIFKDELVQLTVTVKSKDIQIEKDDVPQPNITAEELCKLPAILADGNVVSVGNSSVPADGAAALLLVNEDTLNMHNIKPLVRVAGWANVGVNPLDTGLGAASAIKKLLDIVKLRTEDIDLFEINETFASETLVTLKELKLDSENVNVSGGAIAMGHPVAATGARMVTHLAYQLNRQNRKRGVAASSCGGGQGVAILLEKI